jgi:hypothetical protein
MRRGGLCRTGRQSGEGEAKDAAMGSERSAPAPAHCVLPQRGAPDPDAIVAPLFFAKFAAPAIARRLGSGFVESIPMASLVFSLSMLLIAGWLQPAGDAPAAESVMVAGHGAVDLTGFECIFIGRSARVSRLCHDAVRDMAIAEIGGRHVLFCDMTRELVDAWLAAPSMGRFHAALLDGHHRCEAPG